MEKKVQVKREEVVVAHEGQSLTPGFFVVTTASSCMLNEVKVVLGMWTFRVIWPESSAPVEVAGGP